MTVLLYTYFYNISLNALRPTFFNIYNLPFLCSPNIGKIRVKVGPKTNYFFLLYELLHQQNWSFQWFFFHWYVANQETNKTVSAIFFFLNIFWIIYFWLFSCKWRFQNSSNYCNKKWMGQLLEKTQARFCAAVC